MRTTEPIMKGGVHIHAVIPKKHDTVLRRVGRDEMRSRSFIIRKAIEEYCDRRKTRAKRGEDAANKAQRPTLRNERKRA